MGRQAFTAFAGAALLAAALWLHYQRQHATPADQPPVSSTPKKPPAKPAPKPRGPCPDCPRRFAALPGDPVSRAPQLGGTISPDGASHILPLPDSLRWPRNIASHGLGLCTFRSLDYAARWQNCPQLVDLPEKMRGDGVAGGGYPEKLDHIIAKYYPQCPYWNDTSKSWEILAACLASQRMACVDYAGRDPHYHGSIAHCVCVVCFDPAQNWVAILDNNYPALDQIVWMGREEFGKRWAGWCYGLLAQTPGYCPGHYTYENWPSGSKINGLVNYGLESASFPCLGSSILDGRQSNTDAIIAAIGPAMAPIKIDVDHKIEPLALEVTPFTLALAGGAVLLILVVTKREGPQ